jgi:predicted transcriptional regulator
MAKFTKSDGLVLKRLRTRPPLKNRAYWTSRELAIATDRDISTVLRSLRKLRAVGLLFEPERGLYSSVN